MTSLKDKIKDLDFFLQLIIYHYSLPSINNKLKKDIKDKYNKYYKYLLRNINTGQVYYSLSYCN
jgi:hypothetical protein